MDRVRDHICFAVWFVGLSYLALWPMTGPGVLSPGLHLAGALAAAWVMLRLIWLILARLVRAAWPGAARVSLSPARLANALKRSRAIGRRFEAEAPPRWVPRRREFGLRGPPR